MAKRKNEIAVTTYFDGKLDATDVFVGLIAEHSKNTKNKAKEILAKTQELDYNEIAFQDNLVLS